MPDEMTMREEVLAALSREFLELIEKAERSFCACCVRGLFPGGHYCPDGVRR